MTKRKLLILDVFVPTQIQTCCDSQDMRDGFNLATSALSSLLEDSKSKAKAANQAKPEDTHGKKLVKLRPTSADDVAARIAQPLPTLELKLPLPWNLQAGEARAY